MAGLFPENQILLFPNGQEMFFQNFAVVGFHCCWKGSLTAIIANITTVAMNGLKGGYNGEMIVVNPLFLEQWYVVLSSGIWERHT